MPFNQRQTTKNVCILLHSHDAFAPVTLIILIHKYDLVTLKMYHCTCKTKTKLVGQDFQKLEHEQDIHKHRHTDRSD